MKRLSSNESSASLTSGSGLSAADIQDFLNDYEERINLNEPAYAQTPHGTYSFIVTDISVLSDGSLYLKVKEDK